MTHIVISSGHSSKCRGASRPPPGLDEVNEARKVVDRVAELLRGAGVETTVFHDDVSTTQDENLATICSFHNAQGPHDLDVSCHFNDYLDYPEMTSQPKGTEVYYYSQQALAADLSYAIATALHLPNRGAKKNTGLYFLSHCNEPAVLLEVAFVCSSADAAAYHERFEEACQAIAEVLGGIEIEPPEEVTPELPVHFAGTCSWFGGPDDDGVSPSEDLAWLETWDQVVDAGLQDYFLPTQPPGTSGLARRLDPETHYIACRWDYDVTPKDMLRDKDIKALVRANDREELAQPMDWGPNEQTTGRAADLSPGLMDALGIDTDSQVEVIYPAPADQPQPEPEVATVNIQISASGPVRVVVNGTEIGEL